jgi:deazaflavin-dependent oxidoreductase (nitroreductase family)
VSAQYRAPGWFTRNLFNPLVAFLTRQGISVLGSRVLAVKGRKSGEWRTTPVNLLTYEGRRYLVAPRGETQWVRNLRAVGTGELRVGRRTESFRGRELTDDQKVPVLRAYLRRWKAEVGIFFEGTGPDSSDDQIRAIAPKHPAFEVLSELGRFMIMGQNGRYLAKTTHDHGRTPAGQRNKDGYRPTVISRVRRRAELARSRRSAGQPRRCDFRVVGCTSMWHRRGSRSALPGAVS